MPVRRIVTTALLVLLGCLQLLALALQAGGDEPVRTRDLVAGTVLGLGPLVIAALLWRRRRDDATPAPRPRR